MKTTPCPHNYILAKHRCQSANKNINSFQIGSLPNSTRHFKANPLVNTIFSYTFSSYITHPNCLRATYTTKFKPKYYIIKKEGTQLHKKSQSHMYSIPHDHGEFIS